MSSVSLKLVLILSFLIIIGLTTSSASCSYVIESDIEVEVYDIDVLSREASLNIKVKLWNETLSYPTVKFLVSGGGSIAEFYCGAREQEGYYTGETGEINWKMKSFGEFFPYDFYTLDFWVQQIWRRNDSETLRFEEKAIISNRTYGRIYPSENSEILVELWDTTNDLNYIQTHPVSTREFFLLIRRNPSNWNNLLQFIFPLLFAYAFLGATMALDSKEKLSERLTVYLALFAFSPTFLFSIQKYLPFHISFTIPEFLITNLIITVSIFGVFSIISHLFNKKRLLKLRNIEIFVIMDAIAIILSGLVFAYLYNRFYITRFLDSGLTIPYEASILFYIFELVSYIMSSIFIGIRLFKNKKDPEPSHHFYSMR